MRSPSSIGGSSLEIYESFPLQPETKVKPMCGIVALVTPGREVRGDLMSLIATLENRGYDGAGLSTITKAGLIQTVKCAGTVGALRAKARGHKLKGPIGFGHTRWATHGGPTDENAHPHTSWDKRIALVHNGQIQNHAQLRRELQDQGHSFHTEVDSEVLANLIAREYRKKELAGVTKYRLEQAVASAIPYLKTTEFAIVVMSKDSPRELVIARRVRPIVVGIQNGEYYVASERSALAGRVPTVLDLTDNTVATISCEDGVHVEGVPQKDIAQMWESIGVEAEDRSKNGHSTFLQKEIYDQPRAIAMAFAGRVNPDTLEIRLGMFENGIRAKIKGLTSVVLAACGTSHNAAQVAAYYFEHITGIHAKAVLASEFQYALPLIGKRTAVIGVSQSGETADTVSALRLAKERGALTLGVTNAPGSQIAKLVDTGVYLKAGIELSVASTKAFTSQAAVLLLMALEMKVLRGRGQSEEDREIIRALLKMPSLMQESLTEGCQEPLRRIAAEIAHDIKERRPSGCPMFIGAGYAVPWTYEATLKFLELNNTNAQGRAAGEFKHGYLAMVEKGVKVIAAIFPDGNEDRVLTNCEQIRSKGGYVIALDATGEERARGVADMLIPLPNVPEPLIPIMAAIPVQLLALFVAELQGFDVDHPRNLAKSVTVE